MKYPPRFRLRIQMRVYAEPEGTLLDEQMVASVEQATAIVARLRQTYRGSLRVEHALGPDSVVIQHFDPVELEPLCSCYGFADCEGMHAGVRCRIAEAPGPIIL